MRAMAMMFGAMALSSGMDPRLYRGLDDFEGPSYIKGRRDKKRATLSPSALNDQEFLVIYQEWIDQLTNWNDKNPNMKLIYIEDFLAIRGTSLNNAYKRAKLFLAEAGIHPQTEIKEMFERLSLISKNNEE